MLLKNPFAKSTPATEPAGSSMPEADKALKLWELEQGRTRKRVEELTGQLDTARRTFADAKQAYGEREIEGVDTSEAEAAMQRAEGRVRALEVALTIAKQKDEAAQAERNNAKRQVVSDSLVEAAARLNAHGPEGDALFTALEEFCIDVSRDKEAVRLARLAMGDERHTVDVAELSRQFELFVARAANPLTGQGILPSRLMRFSSWSDCLAAVCGVKAQP